MLFKKKIWKETVEVLPFEGEKVLIKTRDGEIYSSIYSDKKFTLYQFIGLPFYDLEDVEKWCNYEKFLKETF